MCKLIVCLILGAIAAPAAAESDLDILVGRMTGSFTSQRQSMDDKTFYDLRIDAAPIWTDRADGPWLYMEHSAATSLDRPYLQRVYHLSLQRDGSFRSEAYALSDPLRFAGAWKRAAPFADLTPDSLHLREGCAVILRKDDKGSFVGSTVDKKCKNRMRGAEYVTTEMIVGSDRIERWDRGFTSAGKQVFGARKGSYVFLRRGNAAP